MKVLLISMPWAYYELPSIQISSLKSFLQSRGVSNVDCEHFFLKVGDWLGEEKYNAAYRPLIEDAESLYGALLFDEIAYKLRVKNLLSDKFQIADSNLAKLQFLNSFDNFHIEQFKGLLSRKEYDLVGFTLNFGQTLSSIYAARLVKSFQPKAKVILGGAEVSDELGVSLIQNFPDEIDFICNGEGELPLLNLISNNLDSSSVEGIITGDKLKTNFSQIKDISELPLPDYSDYFEHRKKFDSEITLPYESSRGCYYKCNFCALNLQWSGYRQKKPEKVLDDINSLNSRYGVNNFFYVDNITPTQLEKRAELFQTNKVNYDFFYEARCTLTKTQFEFLKKMGVSKVQLGIEAFSNGILKKFNKKSTVLHNIAAIKYCAELGIKVVGNLITEHPDSTKNEIDETIRIIELCFGYPPVDSISPYALEVGSPDYNKLKNQDNSFTNYRAYKRAYPLGILDNLNLPRKEVEISEDLVDEWHRVEQIVNHWQRLYLENPRTLLSYKLKDNIVTINDFRYDEHQTYHLNKIESVLFNHIDTPKEVRNISKNVGLDYDMVASILSKFESMNIIYTERNKCIALPIEIDDSNI